MADASSNVGETFRRAEKLKREVDALLETFAQPKAGGGSAVAAQQRLALLSADLVSSSQQVKEEVAAMPEKGRAAWDRKAQRLEEDVYVIQSAVDKQLGQFYKVSREEDNRKKLFGDRDKKKGPDDEMQSMARENRALRESSSALDEVLEQGRSILGNIVGQNKVLKMARRKLLDAANVMGVSQSLVNVIDRRSTGDKWLVYGGMSLTLFILLSLFYLLRM
ncbi:unnamed protein product [Polarella glacialis]|uniref:Golgi SNAP receptor complex member 2 n=1 Tax=Polarella glacialis TaxID=89957 RepID=A0A813L6L1_POLGL|nr:unnamed protein product [Polarella glacialis]CAE8716516.1 unnamed protein product [Polarella glacialis]